ncbi:16348_t:CDS:2 [Funneliformis geosporum]|uniref:5602_t:CDS:1 n=1 Tax=Funneliformis geosporum TaxID=1117311 RepID=A0A9W4SKK4_9GLOM|nr:16348_t:CDS:2 [Funneliformis geosporum]CAI2171833.1 5602_t:CDS:2 [Funneliformis geosporum]
MIELETLCLPSLRKEQPNHDTLLNVLKNLQQYFFEKETKPIWEMNPLNGCGEKNYSLDQKNVIEWLTKLVASSLEWMVDDSERDDVLERAAKCLSSACGKVASGPIVREWRFLSQADNGHSVILKIRDTTLLDDDVGFKTWGAAYLLARRSTSGFAMPLDQLRSIPILEIGTGTGLVGLTCAKLGCPKVILTDYHPRVLSNVAYNVQSNQLDSTVHVEKLDWEEIAYGEKKSPISDNISREKFEIIVGADIVYEIPHTDWIPKVINHFLLPRGIFYLTIPLRSTHTKEVTLFEKRMCEHGFIIKRSEEERGLDDFSGMQEYRYYEWIKLR